MGSKIKNIGMKYVHKEIYILFKAYCLKEGILVGKAINILMLKKLLEKEEVSKLEFKKLFKEIQ